LVGIERFVDQIADGDYRRRVIVRRGDDLVRLAAKLNAMAESLEKKYGTADRRKPGDRDAG
jgi:HAMP domain-containing protein